MRSFNHLRIINLKLLIVSFIVIVSNHVYANNYSLYETLDNYGYSTLSQKKSLENLMHYANIIPPKLSFKDYYPNRGSSEKLIVDILDFVQQTQKSFTIRTNKQERWEVKTAPEWMNKYKEKIFKDMKELGFIEKILPKQKETDAICILGATSGSMLKRINYAAELLNTQNLTAKNLILLAGERKVTIGIDGKEEDLQKIAEKYNLPSIKNLTETHLIEDIYKNSSIYNKLSTFVIDTPAGNLPRPTTETTVLELLKWLKDHKDIKNIVFISNQPTVKYQKAVITQILKNADSDIAFEVIGPEVQNNIETLKLVEALGSSIWAETPLVISKSGYKIPQYLLAKFKELYAGNTLIYYYIDHLFKNN